VATRELYDGAQGRTAAVTAEDLRARGAERLRARVCGVRGSEGDKGSGRKEGYFGGAHRK
jgi:hypothetical protein